MGSWSESCGFSGIEIAEGEVAYCMLFKPSKHGSLNDGAFHYYTPTTTLLRGTYNDYGQLRVEDTPEMVALFNEQAGLELKNGDDFSLDQLDGSDAHRWWIHGKAFDTLRLLVPDFPYASDEDEDGKYKSVQIKNIGEAQDVHFAMVRRKLDQVRERISEAQGDLDLAMALMSLDTSRLFGWRAPALSGERFQKDLLAGVDVTPRLDGYRRISTLQYAMGELRKSLGPCESVGPQHGGEVASIQFAQAILDIQRERAKRWDD